MTSNEYTINLKGGPIFKSSNIRTSPIYIYLFPV